MKLFTTIKELKRTKKDYGHRYGEDGWVHLKKELNIESEDQQINITDMLPVIGIEGCVWALRTQSYKDICLFLADVAEMALPFWTQEYPSDQRLQHCINTIRKFAVGSVFMCELWEASEAFDPLTYVATTSGDVTNITIVVGTAASAAARAVHAAANGYDVDATDAVISTTTAADIAFCTNNTTATVEEAATERKKIWQQIETLFIKHFGE